MIGRPGRLQGLNTGVVLYHLDRMRQSWLYNSYLHPEAVDHLMDRYHLKMSVGDQDWFTALSFAQRRLFIQLPCIFNTQTSLQRQQTSMSTRSLSTCFSLYRL